MLGNMASILKSGANIARMTGIKAAKGGYGATAAGAVWGAGIGAAWGAMSSDTSVIGGAMMGAGMGAVGGRYGYSGMRRGLLGKRGIGVGGTSFSSFGGGINTNKGVGGFMAGFGKGVYNRARMDYRGTRLIGNKAINRVRSSLSGWTGGLAPL